jgi:hypothetical protein
MSSVIPRGPQPGLKLRLGILNRMKFRSIQEIRIFSANSCFLI